ncbi:MAG: hypothetical protein IPL99_14845 [Candidatus Competibacteraceae bacterium]|nr:hypothetical protein [Candidatus Competibacteraceae bacterium]
MNQPLVGAYLHLTQCQKQGRNRLKVLSSSNACKSGSRTGLFRWLSGFSLTGGSKMTSSSVLLGADFQHNQNYKDATGISLRFVAIFNPEARAGPELLICPDNRMGNLSGGRSYAEEQKITHKRRKAPCWMMTEAGGRG